MLFYQAEDGIRDLTVTGVQTCALPILAIVRRLNFCQWTDAEAPWLSRAIWTAAKQDYELEQLRGRRAWAGLDLSSTTDLTGLTFLVEPAESAEPWKLICFAWLPEDGLDRKR